MSDLLSQAEWFSMSSTEHKAAFHSLYFRVPKREILFSYPQELNLFPIIARDGYLFAKYKSGVLGDK